MFYLLKLKGISKLVEYIARNLSYCRVGWSLFVNHNITYKHIIQVFGNNKQNILFPNRASDFEEEIP